MRLLAVACDYGDFVLVAEGEVRIDEDEKIRDGLGEGKRGI